MVSGDVHHSEILKVECYTYPIYEIVSSGLTHTVQSQYGLALRWCIDFIYSFVYNFGPRIYEKSFASIEIKNGMIVINLRDSYGNIRLNKIIDIRELSGRVKTRSYVCNQSNLERNIKHWTSMIFVYILPIYLNCYALILILRKYTKSY